MRNNAEGLPITGWSTTGGDLRVPHFLATHLMQALPMAGWLADRVLRESQRRIAVWMALAIGVLVVVVTFMQAPGGMPLTGR